MFTKKKSLIHKIHCKLPGAIITVFTCPRRCQFGFYLVLSCMTTLDPGQRAHCTFQSPMANVSVLRMSVILLPQRVAFSPEQRATASQEATTLQAVGKLGWKEL